MEKYDVKKDVKVLCLPVLTFPEGIQPAFQLLEKNLPADGGRNYYGISYLDASGKIIYKAAAEQLAEDEESKFDYEPFIITKGEYLAVTIKEWRKHLTSIGDTFMKLMEEPLMDKTYPCIEWYMTEEEMMCMVKIDSSKIK